MIREQDNSIKSGKTKNLREKNVGQVLYKASSEGVFVVNRKGVIQTVNPSVENMFGYSKKELKNKNILMLIPELIMEADCFDPTKKSTFSVNTREIQGIKKDFEKFPIKFSCNHFDAEGADLVMILITNLTETRRKEMELMSINAQLERQIEKSSKAAFKSEHMFRMIARNFPNGLICILDKDLNFVYLDGMELHRNDLASRLLHGDNFLKKIDREKRFEIKRRLLSALQGQQSNFELKVGRQTFMVNAVGLEETELEEQRILIVAQNISSLKKAQKEILVSLKKEKELNEVKSRFVSMASHEFKTPLTTILNSTTVLSKLLQNEESGDKGSKQIKRIKSTINLLNKMLEDVLSLQQLEEGKLEVHFSEVDLPQFTDSVLEEMRDIAKVGQKIEYAHNGPSLAFLDYNMLKNIYHNLISNAIKYSEVGQRIDVRTSIDKNQFKLEVEDQGIGIPFDEQGHIFERFFRAKNTVNRQGTGLGLNIVKKYMEMVNGDVAFESRPGKGTKFTVEIPLEITSVEISNI